MALLVFASLVVVEVYLLAMCNDDSSGLDPGLLREGEGELNLRRLAIFRSILARSSRSIAALGRRDILILGLLRDPTIRFIVVVLLGPTVDAV